jgi:hypothetical protein
MSGGGRRSRTRSLCLMLPAPSETVGAIAAALAKAQGELSRQPSATQRLSNAAMVPSYQCAFVTWLAHRAARPFYGILPLRCEPSRLRIPLKVIVKRGGL